MTPRTFGVLVLATVLVSGGCVHAPPDTRILAESRASVIQPTQELDRAATLLC